MWLLSVTRNGVTSVPNAAGFCQQLAHSCAYQGRQQQLHGAIVEFTQQDYGAEAAELFEAQHDDSLTERVDWPW